MSYTENYIIEEYGSRIRKKDLLRMTMLETLEKRVGVSLGRVEHEIEITRAGAGIAEKLGIATLDPVLTIRTFVCDKAKKPVEIVWTYFVESKYKFKVTFDE